MAPDAAGKTNSLAKKLLSLFGLCFVCSMARQEPARTHSPSPGGRVAVGSCRGLILPQPSCCKPQITPAEPPDLLRS